MENPILYRKRLLPEECVLLKDDIILYQDDDVIVTKWSALHPKKDLHHGYSCYYLKEGFKISKFYRVDGSLMYYYCDIVDYDYTEVTNTLIVTDLLADVIIYPNGFVKVVDIDEMVSCLDNNKITIEQLKESLTQLDKLLQIIYNDKFDRLTDIIDKHEMA